MMLTCNYKISLELSLGYLFTIPGTKKNKESQHIFPNISSFWPGNVLVREGECHFNTVMEQAVWGKVLNGLSRNLDRVQVKSRMCAFLSANTYRDGLVA